MPAHLQLPHLRGSVPYGSKGYLVCLSLLHAAVTVWASMAPIEFSFALLSLCCHGFLICGGACGGCDCCAFEGCQRVHIHLFPVLHRGVLVMCMCRWLCVFWVAGMSGFGGNCMSLCPLPGVGVFCLPTVSFSHCQVDFGCSSFCVDKLRAAINHCGPMKLKLLCNYVGATCSPSLPQFTHLHRLWVLSNIIPLSVRFTKIMQLLINVFL